MKSSKWTEKEQKCFEHYLKLYHTDFRLIAELLPNRTYTQVRSHYYNELKRKLEQSNYIKEHITMEHDNVDSLFSKLSNLLQVIENGIEK
ncbi:SANT/Myb_domain [Hexamita inflata]|uniref:SANT/Myb domain n=1 Tax=Hexamita inflata TaxID=28002 RepID=A0AA86RJC8_9EUKA|nr:SANT/Myb domain [Hexamita inflata]